MSLIKIKPTAAEHEEAIRLTECGSKTFKRDFSSKDEFKQRGNLGEVVIRNLFGLEPKVCSKVSDGGKDLSVCHTSQPCVDLDIKVQQSWGSYEEQDYGLNVQDSTLDFHGSDYLLFLHYSKRDDIITVAGTIRKTDIKAVAKHWRKGDINPSTGKPFYSGLYEVPKHTLLPFRLSNIKNYDNVVECNMCNGTV